MNQSNTTHIIILLLALVLCLASVQIALVVVDGSINMQQHNVALNETFGDTDFGNNTTLIKDYRMPPVEAAAVVNGLNDFTNSTYPA